jgi:putative transposase
MSKHRKKWSIEEKKTVLLYAKEHGIPLASREYGISSTSIYKWQTEFGEDPTKSSKDEDKELYRELKRLQRENSELKALVANKELAIQIKDALLKKSQSIKR